MVHDNHVVGVLDVDSDQLDHFNETDQFYLEQIVRVSTTGFYGCSAVVKNCRFILEMQPT